MKATIITFVLAAMLALPGQAQRYLTKNGNISFFSETPIENIEAHNKQVNAALDITSGKMVFKVLMKSFEFEKALMQEHFNENYVESDKYPSATFDGLIKEIDVFGKEKPETMEVSIEGKLTIHGVTREISEKGSLQWKEDGIKGDARFMVAPADYDIKIPNAVMNNIAKEIEVVVDVDLKQF
jgi:polyisoprenoid-binding protein YceI